MTKPPFMPAKMGQPNPNLPEARRAHGGAVRFHEGERLAAPEAHRAIGGVSPVNPASHISPNVRAELGKLNPEHAARIRAKAGQK